MSAPNSSPSLGNRSYRIHAYNTQRPHRVSRTRLHHVSEGQPPGLEAEAGMATRVPPVTTPLPETRSSMKIKSFNQEKESADEAFTPSSKGPSKRERWAERMGGARRGYSQSTRGSADTSNEETLSGAASPAGTENRSKRNKNRLRQKLVHGNNPTLIQNDCNTVVQSPHGAGRVWNDLGSGRRRARSSTRDRSALRRAMHGDRGYSIDGSKMYSLRYVTKGSSANPTNRQYKDTLKNNGMRIRRSVEPVYIPATDKASTGNCSPTNYPRYDILDSSRDDTSQSVRIAPGNGFHHDGRDPSTSESVPVGEEMCKNFKYSKTQRFCLGLDMKPWENLETSLAQASIVADIENSGARSANLFDPFAVDSLTGETSRLEELRELNTSLDSMTVTMFGLLSLLTVVLMAAGFTSLFTYHWPFGVAAFGLWMIIVPSGAYGFKSLSENILKGQALAFPVVVLMVVVLIVTALTSARPDPITTLEICTFCLMSSSGILHGIFTLFSSSAGSLISRRNELIFIHQLFKHPQAFSQYLSQKSTNGAYSPTTSPHVVGLRQEQGERTKRIHRERLQ